MRRTMVRTSGGNEEGGRNKGGHIGDLKTAMHTWAMQRIQEQVPELPKAVAHTLLRAEARTVSAVLHSKSQAQLLESVTWSSVTQALQANTASYCG